MQVGDLVRIVKIPDHLPDDEVRELELCISMGLIVPIIDFVGEHGLYELEIGEATGQASYMVSVWLKAEFIEAVI